VKNVKRRRTHKLGGEKYDICVGKAKKEKKSLRHSPFAFRGEKGKKGTWSVFFSIKGRKKTLRCSRGGGPHAKSLQPRERKEKRNPARKPVPIRKKKNARDGIGIEAKKRKELCFSWTGEKRGKSQPG